MKKLNLIFTLFLLAISTTIFSQNEPQTFTQEQLLWFVRSYHPLIKRANLLSMKGESVVRKAKGNFDPEWRMGT